MRKFLIILISFFSLTCYAQDGQLKYQDGQLKCQYSRIMNMDTANSSRVLVTFTLVNGHKPLAISYRQENMKNIFGWQYCQVGDTTDDKLVKVITVNLAPDQSLIWQYAVANSAAGSRFVTIEPAALLVMDEQFEVSKINFKQTTVTNK